MSVIKKLLLWIVALMVFFVALVAGSQNSEVVALTFLDWQTWQMPISFWVLGSFVVGVIAASMVNLWSNTRLRLETRKARKHVNKAQQDLDRVKADSSKTEHAGADETRSGAVQPEKTILKEVDIHQTSSDDANPGQATLPVR